MILKRLLVFCMLVAGACAPKYTSFFANEEHLNEGSALQVSKSDQESYSKDLQQRSCRDPLAYVPDSNHLDHLPWKYIRVNFHWLNATDSSRNYHGPEAIKFVEALVATSNKVLRQNNKMWLPHNNDTPVYPTRYQYRLTPRPNDSTDSGVYFHFDDEVCYYVHKGRNRNLYDREVLDRYGVQRDSVLNIFIMPHHPDSIASPTYKYYGVGVSLGDAIKMCGPFEDKGKPWNYKGILNHEVGHIFGLRHTWAYNDGCEDTPRHPQKCWGRSPKPPCDTLASNNVMDYNAAQNAFSPCQIGIVQQKMADEQSRVRRFIEPNWCTLNERHNIIIRDTVVWEGARDLEGHLTIAKGGSLIVNCRVSLPKGAKISIEAGASLVLNGGRLHNACGDKWKGIEIQKDGKERGNIRKIGQATVEDAEHELIIP